jgi:hypothetical protein
LFGIIPEFIQKIKGLDKYHDLDLMENWTGSVKENLSNPLLTFLPQSDFDHFFKSSDFP